jgi:glucose/arabinose dehydrogenase
MIRSTRASLAAGFALIVSAGAVQAQQDVLPPIPRGDIAIHLDPVATGLGAPLYGTSVPGDPTRLFVLDQKGLVRVMQNGVMLPNPALDMQANLAMNVTNANEERGLLGIAFHPGYNDPNSPGFHTLYTYESEPVPAGSNPTYIVPNGAVQNYMNVITEWKTSAGDPNVIDPATRRQVISFGKNANNHNGGTIAWGPDGYMYLATGDGGNANDVGPSHLPGGNAQNLTVALGKFLRINPLNPTLNQTSTDPVSANGQYRIPADNPFINTPGAAPEIYAYGVRNPYRFAFDRGGTHDLILADVGQNTVEEIDRVVKGGNYGWNTKEGDFLFNSSTGQVTTRSPGSPANMIDPISGPGGTLEYDHGDGISITGGFVYRGSAIPALFGKYVFGDLALVGSPVRVNGRLFYADLDQGVIKEFSLPELPGNIMPSSQTVHGFGEGPDGELYIMATNSAPNGTGGVVYKIEAFVPEPTTFAVLGIATFSAMSRRRRIN